MNIWIIIKAAYLASNTVISSKYIVAVYSDQFVARSRAKFLQLQANKLGHNIIFDVLERTLDMEEENV